MLVALDDGTYVRDSGFVQLESVADLILFLCLTVGAKRPEFTIRYMGPGVTDREWLFEQRAAGGEWELCKVFHSVSR